MIVYGYVDQTGTRQGSKPQPGNAVRRSATAPTQPQRYSTTSRNATQRPAETTMHVGAARKGVGHGRNPQQNQGNESGGIRRAARLGSRLGNGGCGDAGDLPGQRNVARPRKQQRRRGVRALRRPDSPRGNACVRRAGVPPHRPRGNAVLPCVAAQGQAGRPLPVSCRRRAPLDRLCGARRGDGPRGRNPLRRDEHHPPCPGHRGCSAWGRYSSMGGCCRTRATRSSEEAAWRS